VGLTRLPPVVAERLRQQARLRSIHFSTCLAQVLGRRARRVVALLEEQGTVRSAEVARLLGISPRQARNLLRGWVADGWLEMVDPSRRGRRYRLRELGEE